MEGAVAPHGARLAAVVLGDQGHQRVALGSQLGHTRKAALAEPVAQEGAVFKVQFPELAADGVEFDAGHRWPFRLVVPRAHAAILVTGKRRSDGELMLTLMIRGPPDRPRGVARPSGKRRWPA